MNQGLNGRQENQMNQKSECGCKSKRLTNLSHQILSQHQSRHNDDPSSAIFQSCDVSFHLRSRDIPVYKATHFVQHFLKLQCAH